MKSIYAIAGNMFLCIYKQPYQTFQYIGSLATSVFANICNLNNYGVLERSRNWNLYSPLKILLLMITSSLSFTLHLPNSKHLINKWMVPIRKRYCLYNSFDLFFNRLLLPDQPQEVLLELCAMLHKHLVSLKCYPLHRNICAIKR